MTVTDVAAELGVAPDSVRHYIRAGTIKATKHGRDWFIQPAEVSRYKARRRVPAAVQRES